MDRVSPDAAPIRVSLAAAAIGLMTLTGAIAATNPPGDLEIQRSDGSPVVDLPIYYHLRASDLLPDDATTPEHLLRRFMERHTASDYMGAAEAAEELVRLVKDRPIAHYNLACAMARLGRTDKAIESLNAAVACGWRNVGHTERDWDLASIRDDARYAELIRWMRELIAQEQPPTGPLRSDPIEQVVGELNERAPQLLERYHVPGVSVAVLRDGKLTWAGSFNHPASDAVQSADEAKQPMATEAMFRSGAPSRLSAALSAADQLSRNDLSIAQLMMDRTNDHLVARGLNGDRDRPRSIGINGRGELAGLRPAERTARVAALSGEARMPAALGWPATVLEPTTFQLYCMNIESRPDGEPFRRYCESRVFEPLGLSNTRFLIDEDHASRLVTGHTLLGTPLTPRADERVSDLYCYTTVQDLGRMLEAMMSHTPAPLAISAAALPNTIRQLSNIVPGAGLGIDATMTDDGLRLQLAEEQNGTGCLIRWYPETGHGVVIAFNAEAGPSAALRLAGIALGGTP